MALANYMTMKEYQQLITGGSLTDVNERVKNVLVSRLQGVEGIPYQFMSNVDKRVGYSDTSLGRKYTEKIASRIPLLMLTPCVPEFAKDFSNPQRANITNLLLGDVTGGDLANSYIFGEGRYYTPKLAYPEYWKTVNLMLAAVAKYIGIANDAFSLPTGTYKIGNISWQKELNNSPTRTYFSPEENILFYLDGMSQAQESYNTDMTESSLASMVNGFSSTANELQFVLGGSDASGLAGVASSVTEALKDGIASLSSSVGESIGGGLLGSLANGGADTIVNGGKITFPQIWSDSSNDKSVNVSIKLRSPDHDSTSIFMNVIKPYCKLLALALPRTMENAPNGYQSPFLIRAFSKGIFAVDMGVISSMSVTKGDTCCWNDDGLPTQIDIDISIQDLYNKLSMPGGVTQYMTNPTFINYLANLSGLNVGTLDITNKGKLFTQLVETSVSTAPSSLYTSFNAATSNIVGGLYDRLN